MKILIIEDDSVVAHWEALTLKNSDRLSVETFCVSSLAKAVDFMRTTPVDAVILDPGLPDNPGSTIAAVSTVLSREFPEVPIVVVTGRVWEPEVPNVEVVVRKPVKAEGLIEALLAAITDKAARKRFEPIKATLKELENSAAKATKENLQAGPEPRREAGVKDKS